jgi:hydrogenase maturation protease
MSDAFEQIATPDQSSRNAQTLLLGLGNDVLCDDAIGLLIAREIRKRGQHDLDIRETSEIGLSLLDYIIGYKNLIIVASIQTHTAPPGYIHDLDAAELNILPIIPPHFLGIGEMITLGKQIGLQVPERLKIFAIEIEDAQTITDHLTPSLQNALPQIIDRLWSNLLGLTPTQSVR